MTSIPVAQPPCYVFDTSSLIQLEKSPGLQHLHSSPGKWLVVPSKVAKQLNSKGAPAETKKWLNSGKVATFTVDSEGMLFMKIRVEERLLEDADIQGIVIAYHRKGTYVVEEGRATKVAQSLGVRTLNADTFLHEVRPYLPGFG